MMFDTKWTGSLEIRRPLYSHPGYILETAPVLGGMPGAGLGPGAHPSMIPPLE